MDKLILANLSESCNFCGLNKQNEIKYGPLYKLNNVTAHYYCVLLSNAMVQNGADNEGMLGFLLPDIEKVLTRSINDICQYCQKGHATIKCCKGKCRMMYHQPCGLENGSLFQFFGSFKNFCPRHKPVQNIPKNIFCSVKKSRTICSICYTTINLKKLNDILWAPCCKKTWYHKYCIQKLAHSAGYLFRCAICNDKKKFRKWMLRFGIFIPQKDASWELVPNAFEELLYRYNKCDAEICKCPEGREKNLEETWEIILCQSCGSQGIHIACGQLKFLDPEWECSICSKIMNKQQPQPLENSINNSENLSLQKKSNEESLAAPSYSKLGATPSSSQGLINPISSPESLQKKRKLSEEIENYVLDKRNKEDFDSHCSNELIDIETVDIIKVNENINVAEVSSSEIGNDFETKKCSTKLKESLHSSKSTKKPIEIVIYSSDSECEVLELSDESDDEVIIIEESKSRVPKKKGLKSTESNLNFVNKLKYTSKSKSKKKPTNSRYNAKSVYITMEMIKYAEAKNFSQSTNFTGAEASSAVKARCSSIEDKNFKSIFKNDIIVDDGQDINSRCKI